MSKECVDRAIRCVERPIEHEITHLVMRGCVIGERMYREGVSIGVSEGVSIACTASLELKLPYIPPSLNQAFLISYRT